MFRRSLKLKMAAAGAFCLLSVLAPFGRCQEAAGLHEEHAGHVGLLIGPVYAFDNKKWSLGLGAEYEYVLPRWSRLLGIGVGAEMDLGAQKQHYEIKLPISVHLTETLTLSLAPGIQYSEQEEPRTLFASHIGAEYELEFKKIFLSPEFDIAYANGTFHVEVELHFGVGF